MAAPLPRRTSCENEVMMQRKHVCGRENESILARAIAWPDNRIVSWSNNRGSASLGVDFQLGSDANSEYAR
jgi:hypothetical protein